MARRRSNSWQADITVQGKRVRQDGFATKEEALEYEARVRSAVRLGKALPSTLRSGPVTCGVTLGEAYKRAWESRWRNQRSASTAALNAQAALRFFGKKREITEITTELIDEYVAHLESQGNSDATVNRKMSALMTMLRMQYNRNRLEKMPHWKQRRERESRHREYSPDEEGLIINLYTRWSMPEMVDAVCVLIDTGMREGEFLKMHESWLNFKDRTIIIPASITKSGKRRLIPMSNRVASILRRRQGAGLVFGDLSKTNMRYRWDKMRTHLGFDDDPGFVIHSLRHTCGSRLVQAGVNLYTVMEWLGHSSMQVTMRYAKVAPKNLLDARDVLDSISKTNHITQVESRVVRM